MNTWSQEVFAKNKKIEELNEMIEGEKLRKRNLLNVMRSILTSMARK